MLPPPPRAPRTAAAVLEEDEWTLYLEEIIERDFFPDLAALKNRLDWLQASRSGSAEAIRDAQQRIQARAVCLLALLSVS
jgi:protein DGCR14